MNELKNNWPRVRSCDQAAKISYMSMRVEECLERCQSLRLRN